MQVLATYRRSWLSARDGTAEEGGLSPAIDTAASVASSAPPSRTHAALAACVVFAAALGWTLVAHPPTRLGLVENTLLRVCLLGIPTALWFGRAPLSSLAGFSTRLEAWIFVLVCAAALGLRVATEGLPWHAFNWFESLAERSNPEPDPFWYGNGFAVFVRIPFSFGLPIDEAILWANRFAGAAIAPAVYALDRAVGGSVAKALVSAAIIALLPIHAQLSASESMQLIPSLFAVIAWFGFAAHVRTRSRALLLAGMLGLFYSWLARPESCVLAAALPLLYVGKDRWRNLLDPALWIASFFVLLAGVPLLLHATGFINLGGTFGGWGGHPQEHYLPHLGPAWTQFHEALTTSGSPMVVVAILAAVGYPLLIIVGQWQVIALLFALAAQILIVGFDFNFANRWQLQIAEWPMIAIGASAVPWLLLRIPPVARTLDRVPRWAALAGVALALTTGAIGSRLAQPRGWDMQDEWRFLRDHDDIIQSAGPALPLVYFRRYDDVDDAFPWFPSYRLRRDVPVYGLKDLAAGKVPLPALYYRGPHCFTRYDKLQFTGAHHRPICDEAERNYMLEPLATATLTSGSFTGTWEGSPASIEIGLYRLSPRAPSGAKLQP